MLGVVACGLNCSWFQIGVFLFIRIQRLKCVLNYILPKINESRNFVGNELEFFFSTKREGREGSHRGLESQLPQGKFSVWQEASLEGSQLYSKSVWVLASLVSSRKSVWQLATLVNTGRGVV